MSLVLIAALTWPDRVIGKDNGIPWKISADLKRFKALTLGHPVIMGRHTWESLPFKLQGRTNIVLSRQAVGLVSPTGSAPDGHFDSLDAALKSASEAPGGEEIYVIGGAEVYEATLPRADRLALTLVHHPFDGDARFPEFDPAAWKETSRERHAFVGEPTFDYEFLVLDRA